MGSSGNGNIPTWVNIRVKLGDLKPWALNPRHITKKQAERLAASFDSFGQVETVAVSPSLDVYNGHQRLSVLHKLYGPDYEIDARQASRSLTDDERRKLVIYLHAGAVGGWDWDSLSSWPSDSLMQWGFDGDLLGEWKRDTAALGNLLESETPEPQDAEPQIDVDRAEEWRIKWGIELGQTWRIGEHRLHCGESQQGIDAILGDYKPDAVITDPPYGINIVKGLCAAIGGAKPFGRVRQPGGRTPKIMGKVGVPGVVEPRLYRPVANDDKPFDPTWLLSLAEVCILFGANHYASRLPDSPGWIVWEKGVSDQSTFSACELIWCNAGKHVRRYEWRWSGMVRAGDRDVEMQDRIHPTQKPVGLIENIIRDYTDERAIIIDPYLGSGTTMLASARTNRICVGGELDAAYCAVTLERMATAFPDLTIERIGSNATDIGSNGQ